MSVETGQLIQCSTALKTGSHALRCITLLILLALTAFAQDTPEPTMRPDRGAGAPGSYSVSDIESINLTNGNVSLSIPLASLPPIAGGKLSWTVSAIYNSKLYDLKSEQQFPDSFHSTPYFTHSLQRSAEGGWRIGGTYNFYVQLSNEDVPDTGCEGDLDCFYKSFRYKRFMVMPDGSRHEMRPLGALEYSGPEGWRHGYYQDTTGPFYSYDGSYLWATINSGGWTLYLPDGTRVEQSNGIQRIYDTNGNSIKIYSDGDPFGVTTTHYVDEQTGREIKMLVDFVTKNRQVQYQTAGGNWATIDIIMGGAPVQGLRYNINDRVCTKVAFEVGGVFGVREIILPQTEAGAPRRKFTFNYNNETIDAVNFQYKPSCSAPLTTVTSASHGWGALSKIIMPSGAEVEYDYSLDGPNSYDPLEGPLRLGNAKAVPRERITQKRLKHDGQVDTWTYQINGSIGTMNGPDGSTVREYSYPIDPGDAGCVGSAAGKGGLILRSERYGAGTTSKVITERQWGHKIFEGGSTVAPRGIVVFNPVVDAEYTTLVENSQAIKMSAKQFQYDFNGNITQTTEYDWFDPALVSRDANGVPTGVPAGAIVLRTTTTSHYNPATTSNSGNVYAKRNDATATPLILNAPQQTTTGPSQTQFSYDNQGYGAAPTIGNLTRVSNWDDQAGTWRNTTYGYDSYGNRITITDPRNNVTNIAFDLATHAQPTQVTVDPLNGTGAQTTTTVYDFWTGLVTSVTDPNNQTTTTSYINQLLGAVDPFGRPGVVTGPPVNSVVDGVTYTNQQRKVKTTYFDDARQVVVESDLNQTGDFKLKARSSHDQLGRVIKTESNEDGAANYSISTENVYVQPGLITLTSNPKRSAAANTDGWTRATRDLLGRVIEVATFSGATPPPNTGTNSNWTGSVTTSYNANQVTVTDQTGKKRRSETDALGRLVKVTEGPGVLNYDTTYFYDSLDNLRRVNQGVQGRWFSYDSLSRLIRARNMEQNCNPGLPPHTDPFTGGNCWSTAYSYDANGNLVSKTDARNITTNYAYDALNRNTKVDYSDTIVNPDITRVFDNTNPGTNGKGRFWHDYAGGNFSIGQEVEHTAIDSYDALGRPLTKRQLFKKNGVWSGAYSVSHTYDLAGNIKSLTYPSGHTVNYSHDQAGRLSGFSGNLGGSPRTYADTIGYNAAGQMIKERLGTNTLLYHNRHYNNRQQLVAIRLGDNATDAWTLSRGAFDFLYGTTAITSGNLFASDTDNNGNLRRQINFVPLAGGGYVIPQQDDYAYDALNRISSFTESQRDSGGQWTSNVAWQNFNYDRYGNRQITGASGGVSNYNPSYDQPTNRINGLGYDAAGNITSDPLTGGTMTYDAENRLLTATSGGGGSYVYNADGKRVRRITAGQETWHVYGCGGELLAEYAAGAQPTAPLKEYGYRGGQLLIIAESGSGGGVSFVKPALKSTDDLIGKADLEADGAADGLSLVDEPVADLEFNEDFGSTTAGVSSDNHTGTHIDGVTGTTAGGYGNTTSANGVGGELLAEHPAGVAPSAPQKEYGYRSGRSIVTVQGGGVVTLNPSSNQSPDPGQVGTLAVTDISNTGHGSTLTGVSAFDIQSQPAKNNTQQRSAIWSSFQSGPSGVASLKLKFDWTASGNVNASVEIGGSASARIDYDIRYSIDGGSSWTTALSRFRQVSQSGEGSQGDSISDGGSVEVVLSPSQDISLVQVRDFMKANATANAPGHVSGAIAESGAGITTSVSLIRLEVDAVPVITGVSSSAVTHNSATISWNTNEPADSQVEYGTTTAYGQSTPLDPAIVTAHSQGLSGLTPGTLYHYRVKSRDATGNLAFSGDHTFITAPPPDTTAPVISNVDAVGITTTSATINWTTNENSDSQVEYGTTTAYGQSTTLNPAIVTAHSQGLSGLTSGTLYHYRVKSRDAAGNLAVSGDFTFTTAQTDTTPPTVASFTPGAGATSVNANANVTVTFSEAMNPTTVNGSTVELRDPLNTLVSATVSYNAASLTATLDPTASLTAGVTYTARVRGGGTDPRVKDVAGNALAADLTWTFTTAQNGSGGIKWLVTDHLGSTRMVIDETGSLAGIKRHDFAPFGEELFAGIGIRSASLGYGADSTRQKFTSKERDDETGLDYFLARYYSSTQGRFTGVDPLNPILEYRDGMGDDEENERKFRTYLVQPQNWNRYSYVINNPLALIDPDGREGGYAYMPDGRMIAPGDPNYPRTNTPVTDTLLIGGLVAAGIFAPEAVVTIAIWAARNPHTAQRVAEEMVQMSSGNPASAPSRTVTLAANTGLRPAEIASGTRLAKQIGGRLVESTHVGADFVEAFTKKTFDVMGTPAAYTAKNFGSGKAFFDSILHHVNKSVDYVAIDLKGASKQQIAAIQRYVSNLTKEQRDKIIYISP